MNILLRNGNGNGSDGLANYGSLLNLFFLIWLLFKKNVFIFVVSKKKNKNKLIERESRIKCFVLVFVLS